jgi:hypothetical protein
MVRDFGSLSRLLFPVHHDGSVLVIQDYFKDPATTKEISETVENVFTSGTLPRVNVIANGATIHATAIAPTRYTTFYIILTTRSQPHHPTPIASTR